jgi:hypothetical protein
VVFKQRKDADKVIKQLQGVPLDGKPLNLALVGVPGSAPAVQQVAYAPMPRQQFVMPMMRGMGMRGGRGRGGPRGGGRGGRGGGGGGGGPRKQATAEELDAKMAEYFQE